MASSPSTVPMEKKVENLRAFVVELAISKRLLLPEPKLLDLKLLDLCSSRTPDHPPYGAMIHEAITELNEAGGSSEEVISEFIKSKYKDLPYAHTSLLSHHLAKLVKKEEILCDSNNCYMLPGENTASCVDDKRMKARMQSGSPGCGNGTNYQNVAEREDQLKVDQNSVTEAITNQKEEETVRMLVFQENKVENAGNLLEEQDLTITEAEAHAEGETGGAVLQSGKLEVGNRDQTLEEQRSITDPQLLVEKDENTAVFQSGELEDRDLQNCESLGEEKEKQEPGEGHCREEMQVECLVELNGTSRSLVQEPTGQTQEESVMMNCEDGLDIAENSAYQEGAKVNGEARQTENKEGEVRLENGKVEIPKKDGVVEEGKVTLEDRETEGRIEANNTEDENQQKRIQENEARNVNEVEDSCEKNDALMEGANHEEERQPVIIAKQGEPELPTAVEVVKEACREVILERNEMELERQSYKRLGEKQTEACCNIVALKKMLKQFRRSKEQNEAVSAHNNSFGVQHDDVRFGSLPLSKESCKQLWKLVHKIQSQLFEIIDSFDKTEVPNYECQGCEVESMRKELFQEGPKRLKSPRKSNESEKAFSTSKQLEQDKGEIGSHTKPWVKETRVKRPQDVEAAELGESFREQKRRKLCDGQTFSSLVPGGVTWDSSVSKDIEAGCESTEAVAHFCGREVTCVGTTQLERKCQQEKFDRGAEKQDLIGEMQTKARRPDDVAPQVEPSNRTITEPSTSQSKPNAEDGNNGSEQKNAQPQPRERPPKSVNSDTSMTATCFSDHPNTNEKQLQKVAPGTSVGTEISES